MNIEVLNSLRALHKSLEEQSKDFLSKIEVLNDKRMAGGHVLTPELIDIGQQIESLYSKKSKVDQKIRATAADILAEVLKD